MTVCIACGATAPRRLAWRKNGCDILVCPSCGLGAAAASAFDPKAYYTESYFDGSAPDGYADYVGSEAVLRAEFADIVAGLRRFAPAGRLLEIGAAYGFFLMEARAHFDVVGVEMAAAAAEFARGRGLDVRTGPATSAGLADIGPVDAVVMLDVIEHLEDPLAVLTLAAEKLRPGGVLLVTTGDFGSLFAKITGRHWRLMTPPQHLWYFTVCALTKLAGKVGLSPIDRAHPWKRVPVSLIAYQAARMFGHKLSAERLASLSRFGLPINLFDAMRLTFRKS